MLVYAKVSKPYSEFQKDLSDLIVPLPELRTAIAHEMSHGKSSMSVTELLELIRTVYRENKD